MPDALFQDRTPRLDPPLLFAGQSQRETFVNETFARLDALVHCAVEAQTPNPPAAPTNGQCWLVAPAATGAWIGQDGAIACFQQGQWLFQPPRDGLRLLNRATGQTLCHHQQWRAAEKPVPPVGGATIDTQARTAIAALITALEVSGVFADS